MKNRKKNIDTVPISENSLYSLSAEILNETQDNYPCVNRIAEQLSQPDIYNIAITGPYGSGKTSVLKTLEKEHPEHNYLNITLAKFDGKDVTPPIPKKPKGVEGDNRTDDEKLNWLLEYSIMQQLIYHEKYTTIPQSRFKRIKNLSKGFILKSAALVILFFICLAILFEPAFLKATSLYEVLRVGGAFKIIIDAVCAITIIGLLFLFVTNLIKVFGNSRLNKINLKDGEIGFCDDDTNSILNKHLDEILYYFEVTNYNVVIIEDLDRFETPVIFAKLREINTLINYYKPIHDDPNRKIVFIYAVKDDTFTDNTLRSKFFDVIIPVIPVINPSNAGSKLKQLLSEKTADADKIPDSTFRDIGLFIDDMRVLKSIVDDYLQYRPILDSRLEPEKLLAMMTYKNYYPKDFAELPKRKGLLYSILNNKREFSTKLMDAIDKQIAVYQKEISEIEDQKYESLKELKDLYLLRFRLKHTDFRNFINDDKNVISSEDNYDDNVFQRLITGEITEYRYHNHPSYNKTFNTSFAVISKEVDPNKSYFEKADLWTKKQSNEIHRLTQKINELKGDKLRTPYKPIKDLFDDEIAGDINDFIHQNNKDSLDVRLLEFLLRRGLVDEYYEDYTSLFHEGVLTQAERDFLINVRLKKDTDCNHKLNKCEALLSDLYPTDFKESYIFNVSLLTHISQNISRYQEEFKGILEQIKQGNRKAIDFFDCFMNSSEAVGPFLQHMVPLWEDIWLFVETYFEEKKDTYAFLFILHLKPTELKKIDKDNHLSSFLESSLSHFGIWETNINLNDLFALCDTLNLRFTELDRDKVSKKLMQFIVERNKYHITAKNLKEIFQFLEKTADIEELDKANYTAILSSGIKPLIGYIADNMVTYYDQVLLPSDNSINESEDSVIALINDESIGYDKKRAYLLKQTEWITAIDNIAEDFWILSVDSLILYPSWENIISYCSYVYTAHPGETLPDSFKEYLTDQSVYNILKDGEAKITEENRSHVSSLFNEISLSDEYSFEAYSSILNGLYGLKMSNADFSILSKDKVEFLINQHFIPFEEYHLDIIRNSYPDLAISLFIANKDAFLQQAGNYTFNVSEYKDILRSTEFNDSEKVSVIEYMSVDGLNNDRELATLVCRIISIQSYSIEDELLYKLLQLCEDKAASFIIVKTYLLGNNYEESKTVDLLNFLERDYRRITVRNKRPRISETSDMELLSYLKRVGFIKNIIPHDNYIKVINRD